MKKKVLHILKNMDIGGIETYIMNNFRNINLEEYEFHFLLWDNRESYYEKEIRKMGGIIHKFKFSKNFFINIINVRKILKRNFFDVIHCHTLFYSGIFAYANKNNDCNIFISHIHSKSDNKRNGVIRKVYKCVCRRLILKYSKYCCACSTEAAKYVLGKKYNEAIIMNDYIDVQKYINVSKDDVNKIKSRFNISNEEIVLGNVGRLSIEKNQEYIIDLLCELEKKKVKFKCLLVGDGPEYVKLKNYVKKHGLDRNVFFVGFVSDVWNYFKCFDIFVFPSLYEGFGMALLEAQAAGVLCLSSDQVPKNTDMNLGLVKYISLNQKEDWVNEIINRKNHRISNHLIKKRIIEKGFDITNSIEILYSLYNGEIKK